MRSRNKKVCGVGVNDALYTVEVKECLEKGIQKWICPYYKRWRDLLYRCYSHKKLEHRPTYKDCTVCEEWLTFSNFKEWMEQQDWEDKELDKDILVKDNKVYSPNTCAFVTRKVNLFLSDHGSARGEYLLGVSFYKRDNCYRAQININGKLTHLGYFKTEEEAHFTWWKKKYELAKLLCEEIDDDSVKQALLERTKELKLRKVKV